MTVNPRPIERGSHRTDRYARGGDAHVKRLPLRPIEVGATDSYVAGAYPVQLAPGGVHGERCGSHERDVNRPRPVQRRTADSCGIGAPEDEALCSVYCDGEY